MAISLTVIYDGKVLRPEGNVDLRPNTRYRVTIEDEGGGPAETAWELLDQFAGSVEAPPDWAAEHDHYLYGTPKRSQVVEE